MKTLVKHQSGLEFVGWGGGGRGEKDRRRRRRESDEVFGVLI